MMDETIVFISKLILFGIALTLLGLLVIPIVTTLLSIILMIIRAFIIPSVFMLLFWAYVILGFLIIVGGR